MAHVGEPAAQNESIFLIELVQNSFPGSPCRPKSLASHQLKLMAKMIIGKPERKTILTTNLIICLFELEQKSGKREAP